MKIQIASRFVCSLLLMVGAPTSFLQGQQATFSKPPSEDLKAFLRSYLSAGNVHPDMSTRILIVNVATNGGKGEEYVIYISGKSWCGSGGCTMLIVEPVKSSYTVLTRVAVAQLPIRLMPSMKNGHPDIGVQVQGGGIQVGYEAVLSFDGKTYPANPSLIPAKHADTIQGKAIITITEDGVPLYE